MSKHIKVPDDIQVKVVDVDGERKWWIGRDIRDDLTQWFIFDTAADLYYDLVDTLLDHFYPSDADPALFNDIIMKLTDIHGAALESLSNAMTEYEEREDSDRDPADATA